MSWYNESIFYHIYPLGLSGAPLTNDYNTITHRLIDLFPWIDHVSKLNLNAIYIGPLFESSGHGYETTDYKKLDSRLGTNDDLKEFVKRCHDLNIKVIFDGVFNHTGRDFFAFKDLKENKQNSRYINWYLDVNFNNNNEFNDGFSYANWGGYNIMAKLNVRNPEVQNYILDVIKFWVDEFDVDGIRLDAADVLDFEFMKVMRNYTNGLKNDFWLMGEVIHGNYSMWSNNETLHSVTNYTLHKGLYNGLNEYNLFEIAHTIDYVNRLLDGKTLYTFVDNHDVARIYSKLNNKQHMFIVYGLLYTLPGIPSIYYGSEFGIEGNKQNDSDSNLRPHLNIEDFKDSYTNNPYTKFIVKLGEIRKQYNHFSYGEYTKLYLTNRQFAFSRTLNNEEIIIVINIDNNDCNFNINLKCHNQEYKSLLNNNSIKQNDNNLFIQLHENDFDILVPSTISDKTAFEPYQIPKIETIDNKEDIKLEAPIHNNINDMTIEELQYLILEKMAKNGPVSEQMKKTVIDNIWHDSLVNWLNSFH